MASCFGKSSLLNHKTGKHTRPRRERERERERERIRPAPPTRGISRPERVFFYNKGFFYFCSDPAKQKLWKEERERKREGAKQRVAWDYFLRGADFNKKREREWEPLRALLTEIPNIYTGDTREDPFDAISDDSESVSLLLFLLAKGTREGANAFDFLLRPNYL